MSNKTRLQTNNTNLQSLIDKANALPDAGGPGGGGSIETCTLTLISDGPTFGNEAIWYTDGSSTVQTTTLPNFGSPKTISVVKNSLVCSNMGLNPSGNAIKIAITANADDIRIYFISGDASLRYM